MLLEPNPAKDKLAVLERNEGKAVNLIVNAKDGMTNQREEVESDKAALENIKRYCRQGRGFCEEPAQPLDININRKLKEGFAIICDDKINFNGYPMMITREGYKVEAIRVVTYAEKKCTPNQSNSSSLLVELSEKDAERANITNDTDKSQVVATMASLSTERPTNSIYLPDDTKNKKNKPRTNKQAL